MLTIMHKKAPTIKIRKKIYKDEIINKVRNKEGFI